MLDQGIPDSSQTRWSDYRRRRNWARISMLALPIALFLIAVTPLQILEQLHSLRVVSPEVSFLIAIGLLAVVFSAPVLRWTEWRCPSCGNKFALPCHHAGTLSLFVIMWNLFFAHRCGACGLPVGS
jgi:hypothetical protein